MSEPLFSKKQIYNMVIPLIMEQVFMAAIGMFYVIIVSGVGGHLTLAVFLLGFFY